MELKTSNSLDLAINKDDLIDIMVDNELTRFEKLIEAKEKEIEDVQTSREKIKKSITDVIEKRLKKLLPIGNPDEIVTISYYEGSPSTDVTFHFKDYSIKVSGLNTAHPITADYKKKCDQITELRVKRDKLIAELDELKKEHLKIEKSPKRLKAKMLNSFLKNSEEGKEILRLLNNESLKMLPEKTN